MLFDARVTTLDTLRLNYLSINLRFLCCRAKTGLKICKILRLIHSHLVALKLCQSALENSVGLPSYYIEKTYRMCRFCDPCCYGGHINLSDLVTWYCLQRRGRVQELIQHFTSGTNILSRPTAKECVIVKRS